MGFVKATLLFLCLFPLSSGDDNDDNFYFANNNNKFFFNSRKNCPTNYYFDIDFFKCRLCDPNFNIVAAEQGNNCICDKNSTEVFEYDNILKRPICEKETTFDSKASCSIRFVNATKFSSTRKSVRVFHVPANASCSCDEKFNENYQGEYCIKKELFKGLNNHQTYKYLPLTQTLNLNHELKYIIFFCKVLHQHNYCSYLANICVLTQYDLDKNGPCYPFYKQQTQSNEIAIDEVSNEGSDLDGGEKLKPFLFLRNRKSERTLFEKSIDFSYGMNNENSTVNFTIVNYDFRGNLIEMRQLKLSDLNLCNLVSAPTNIWQLSLKFARNFLSSCTINLQEFIDLQPDTKFSSLHLNYYEKQSNFLETVPILIRNAFEGNEREDIEKWQLVKRFFLIDTISGRQPLTTDGKNAVTNDDDKAKFYEQYSQITYVKSIELRFHMNQNSDEDPKQINRIKIPLLILEYGTLNLTNVASNAKSSPPENHLYNINFSFKIKFIKRPNLNFFFQIILPSLLFFAVILSLLQGYFFKVRQQKFEYDFVTLLNFIVNLLANTSNALIAVILLYICYVFVVYKTQSSEMKIILPLESDEETIGILLALALVFKVVKLLAIFHDMTNFDIFFVDFERPKYHTSDNFMTASSNKSHPGTPSIASSFKPTISSPTPSGECVSAWRNYFIANEWQELMTKRKICIHLHVVFVIGSLMIIGFENFSSLEFYLHLNHVVDSADSASNNIVLKLAVGAIVYLALYLSQRLYNFLIYERFVDNCLQQFIDVSSIANISVLILLDSFGYYVHGRSVHGRSDIDTFNMILQFRREEENLCGHRGLLPGEDQQTYSLLAPKNLRLFYEKLINPITSKAAGHTFDQGFEKTVLTYHNINRFFAAFIDHALKDVDYVVKEKNLFEKLFDCEIYANVSDSKGVFYFDNGHSFDKVLFYGNENIIFGFEYLLFLSLLFTTGNFLTATLSIGIIFKLIKEIINHLTKNNLARKTLIDKRFLI